MPPTAPQPWGAPGAAPTPSYGQQPPTPPPYGQNPRPSYGQNAPGQPQWGRNPPPQDGQNPPPPPGQNGQPQYGQNPQPQWGQNPPPPPQPYGPNHPTYGQPSPWGPPPPSTGGSPWGPPPPGGTWGPPPHGGGGWSPPRGSGLIPLRPLTVGEIFDGSIRAIRSNPRTMVGFSAAVIAVLSLLSLLPQAFALTSMMGSDLLDPARAEDADVTDLVQGLGLTAIVSGIEYLLATTLVSSLMIVAVDSAVRGRTLGPGELWARCRPRILALLGLAVVMAVTAPVVIGVACLPGIAVLVSGAGDVVGGILLAVGIIAGIVVSVALVAGYWAISAPALLLENLGVTGALRRSFRLVRRSFWRVFGIGLLAGIIVAVVRQIFGVPFGLIGALVGPDVGTGSLWQTVLQLLVSNIGAILAGAVVYPFSGGVSALLYIDLRMRREGLDVELMRPDAAG